MNDILKTLGGVAAEDLQERIDIIRHKLKFIENKPSVACIEKLDPVTFAGDLLPDAIAIAGGHSMFAQRGSDLSATDVGQFILADPDIIIVALRGLGIDQALKEIGALLELPGFAGIKAVKNNQFYMADGRRFYNAAPAVVDTIEMLAEMIHPKQFIFGYEGDGWIKFSM